MSSPDDGATMARRRSWCISTDPGFAQKAADIVGLYLQPPENAVVFVVDFHFTPTHASWLNQVEVWFSILSAKALARVSPRRARFAIRSTPLSRPITKPLTPSSGLSKSYSRSIRELNTPTYETRY